MSTHEDARQDGKDRIEAEASNAVSVSSTEVPADFDAYSRDDAWLAQLVSAEATLKAQELPDLVFDRIWDEFDAATKPVLKPLLPEEPRAKQRHGVFGWLRPLHLAFGVAGVVGLAIVFASPKTEPTLAAKTDQAPGVAIDPDARRTVMVASAPPAPEAADAPQGDAAVEHIEFAGRVGSISEIRHDRGTTTVIWINEELAEDTAAKVEDL